MLMILARPMGGLLKISKYSGNRITSFIESFLSFPQLIFVSTFIASIVLSGYLGWIWITFILLALFSIGYLSVRKSIESINYGVVLFALFLGTSLAFVRVYFDVKQEITLKEVWDQGVGLNIEIDTLIVDEPKARHEEYSVIFQINNASGDENDVQMSASASAEAVRVISRIPRFPVPDLGDKCSIIGVIKIPENYTDFDYIGYLSSKRIYYTLDIKEIRCEKAEWSSSPRIALYSFKKKVVRVIERNLHEPGASLMVGILLGDDRVFDDSFDQSLRVTGTTHIIAASGYNISLITVSIEKMLGRFMKPLPRSLVSLVLIWSFAAISGLSASIVRAVIMASVMIIAMLFGKIRSVHFVLPYTVFIFLFYDPRVVESLGFLLSVLSTASLVYLSPIASKLLIRSSQSQKISRIRAFFEGAISDLFIPTLCCTLGTAPLIATVFGQLTLIGLISNLMILPVVEFIMIYGLLGLIFSGFAESLGGFFFSVGGLLLKYFEVVINRLGEWDWAVISSQGSYPFYTLLIPYLFILIVVILFYPVDEENYYFSKYR